MRRAYVLAREAAACGDHPFSALLVVSGQIVLECLNTVNSNGDATRHPELDILRLAYKRDPNFPFGQAVLYASTEPCAMCFGAIYWSGISTLVYGCPAETLGEIAGGSFVVPSRELASMGKRIVEIIGPVLPEEGAEIHRNFW
jgi:tRNA(Arg) A34 adenosine deaminase TadA